LLRITLVTEFICNFGTDIKKGDPGFKANYIFIFKSFLLTSVPILNAPFPKFAPEVQQTNEINAVEDLAAS